MGVQRELPGTDDSSAAGRARARNFRKPSSRIDFHALAWAGTSHRAGWCAVHQPEAGGAGRKICLRIYGASGGDVLLSRTQRDAGNDGADRIFRGAPAEGLQAARGSRLRPGFAGMGGAAEQHRAKYRGDGIQLADVQWGFRADDDAAAGTAGQPRAAAYLEPGHGSPSDPSSWAPVRDDRDGGRARAGIDVVSDEYGAGGGGAGARGGIRSEVSGRVDDSLPPAAPHDEQHDGFAAGPGDSDGGSDGGKSGGADDVAGKERAVRTRTSISNRSGCVERARVSAGRVHGNGNGRSRGETGDIRAGEKLERGDDGDDDDGSRAARERI